MAKSGRCPICDRTFDAGAPVAAGLPKPAPPFCSQRCKLIDLSRWLGEEYTVSSPGDAAPDAAPWLGSDGSDRH